jgi:hypothetical protein
LVHLVFGIYLLKNSIEIGMVRISTKCINLVKRDHCECNIIKLVRSALIALDKERGVLFYLIRDIVFNAGFAIYVLAVLFGSDLSFMPIYKFFFAFIACKKIFRYSQLLSEIFFVVIQLLPAIL